MTAHAQICALLAFVGIVLLQLIYQIYALGRKMSVPEAMFRTLPQLSPSQQNIIEQYSAWLHEEGLVLRGYFQFGQITDVVFQHGDMPRFFSFLFGKSLSFGVESYLADLTILDTGTSGSTGLFPRPGAYAQSFPHISAQEAWKQHLEAEVFLSETFGFRWVPIYKPYEDLVLAAMRVRMQYTRSQLFWPLRVLYRWAVTRHLIANRSIAEQFQQTKAGLTTRWSQPL